MEEWKTINGYEGLYEVSNFGRIVSMMTNKILKPNVRNKGGYLYVNLYKESKAKKYYIHRLVAEAFLDNPNRLEEVNHINCDKTDNSLNNLEWCDRRTNLEHSYAHGLKRAGEKHGCHKLTWDNVREIRTSILSQKELANKYHVSLSTISAILSGRHWKEGDAKCRV